MGPGPVPSGRSGAGCHCQCDCLGYGGPTCLNFKSKHSDWQWPSLSDSGGLGVPGRVSPALFAAAKSSERAVSVDYESQYAIEHVRVSWIKRSQHTIWNLGNIRYRASDLGYRHITILKLKRSISSATK